MYRLVITFLIMPPFTGKYAPAIKSLKRSELSASSIRFDAGPALLLWMGSLKWTSVASSTIILALQPVFVMIGAYFWFKEKTSLAAIGGMAIAFLGVFLLIGSADSVGARGI